MDSFSPPGSQPVDVDTQRSTLQLSGGKTVYAARFFLRWLAAGVGSIFLIGLAVGYWVIHSSRPPSSARLARSVIKLEAEHIRSSGLLRPPYGLNQPTRTAMAISSDSRFLVYSAIDQRLRLEDKSQLYLRQIDQLEAKLGVPRQTLYSWHEESERLEEGEPIREKSRESRLRRELRDLKRSVEQDFIGTYANTTLGMKKWGCQRFRQFVPTENSTQRFSIGNVTLHFETACRSLSFVFLEFH